MQCQDVEKNLVAWVEGALPDEKRQQVVEHLHACAACAQLAGRMEALWPLRKAPDTAKLSPRFFSTLERRIRERERAGRPVYRWLQPVAPVFRMAALAGGLAVAVWFGTRFGGVVSDRIVPAPALTLSNEHTERDLVYYLQALDDAPSGGLAELYLDANN